MDHYFDNKIFFEYSKSVLHDLLPNCYVSSLSSSEIPENFELNGQNICLQGSNYYNEENSSLNLIHFTSIENFKSIFSTNILRLYDLNFADDPNEILFALKEAELPFSEYQIENIKSGLYSCSFCQHPFISDEEEYNLWRIYGKDGAGVGLIFNINNDYKNWYDFHLSKIYYNDSEKLQKLKNTIDRHYNFIKEMFQEKNIHITERSKLLPRDITKFFHSISTLYLNWKMNIAYFFMKEPIMIIKT